MRVLVAIILASNVMALAPSPSRQVERISTADLHMMAQRAADVLARSKQHQVYIAIAGGPGSGKSHVSALVTEYLNNFANRVADTPNSNADELSRFHSIVIPMDGYHIPQADLVAMGNMGRLIGDADGTSGETTTFDDLMRRRGAPWTFDPQRLCQDLQRAKAAGHGSFPLYDRSISDPVPDQIHVTSQHYIVFCEGNYLLAFDDPMWKPLSSLWDDTWFIDVSEGTIRTRLISRHLASWTPAKEARFGPGREGAIAKIESSDLKNARWINEKSKQHAAFLLCND